MNGSIITHNALNKIQGHDEARSDGVDVIISLLTHSNASHVSLAQQIDESAHQSLYILSSSKRSICTVRHQISNHA